MKVINALNTEQYDEIDNLSCIDYWRRHHPGGDDRHCRACGCEVGEQNPIVGAHVMDVSIIDPHVYIVPLCKNCNDRRADLPAFDTLQANLARVPAEMEQAILSDPENGLHISRGMMQ